MFYSIAPEMNIVLERERGMPKRQHQSNEGCQCACLHSPSVVVVVGGCVHDLAERSHC